GPRPAQAERLRHFGPEARRRGRGTGMQPGEVDIAVAPDETRKPGILEADAAANTGFHAVPFLPVECGTAHARARRAAALASVGAFRHRQADPFFVEGLDVRLEVVDH